MDFLTTNEIRGFRSDVEESNTILDGQKYAFETELLNGLGDSMIKELKDKKNNPPKKDGLFQRFKKIILG